MFFKLMVIGIVIYAVVRYRWYGKQEEVVENEEATARKGMISEVQEILQTRDIEILDEDMWEWYEVRAGNEVYKVYMDDVTGEYVKYIIHGTKVIHRSEIREVEKEEVQTRVQRRKNEKGMQAI